MPSHASHQRPPSKTALLLALDDDHEAACRSALGEDVRLIRVSDAAAARRALSVYGAHLIVLTADLAPRDRFIIADIAAAIDARLVTIARTSSAAAVERLVEGAASIAFDPELDRTRSGIRRAWRPPEDQ